MHHLLHYYLCQTRFTVTFPLKLECYPTLSTSQIQYLKTFMNFFKKQFMDLECGWSFLPLELLQTRFPSIDYYLILTCKIVLNN